MRAAASSLVLNMADRRTPPPCTHKSRLVGSGWYSFPQKQTFVSALCRICLVPNAEAIGRKMLM